MAGLIVKKKSSLTKLYLLPTIGKFLLSLLVFFLLSSLGIYFLHAESESQLLQLKQKKQQLELEVTKEAQSHGGLSYLSKNTEIAKQLYEKIIKQFPPETKVGDLLEDITKLGTTEGLKFIYFKPGVSVNSGYYAALPVDISVVGSFHQLAKFLSGLANLPDAVVVVNQFTLTHMENRELTSNKEVALSFQFTATLYHALPTSLDVKP